MAEPSFPPPGPRLYANLSGKSGVVSYETGPNLIRVTFKDGSTYTYTSLSAGTGTIARMQRLARNGSGLNRYINLFVKKGYSSKG